MNEMDYSAAAVISVAGGYPLHLLGWKAFQDLCVAVAEECLRRPVQIFLPNNEIGSKGLIAIVKKITAIPDYNIKDTSVLHNEIGSKCLVEIVKKIIN